MPSMPTPGTPSGRVYKPFGAAFHGAPAAPMPMQPVPYGQGPPPPGAYGQVQPPPQPVNAVGLQQDQAQEPKK